MGTDGQRLQICCSEFLQPFKLLQKVTHCKHGIHLNYTVGTSCPTVGTDGCCCLGKQSAVSCETQCGFSAFVRPVFYRVKETWQGSSVSHRTFRGPFVLISAVVHEAVIGVQFDVIQLSESYTSAFQSVQNVGQLNRPV
jgi:hypothetical protein